MPKIKSKPKKVKKALYFDNEILSKYKEFCDSNGLHMSKFLELLMTDVCLQKNYFSKVVIENVREKNKNRIENNVSSTLIKYVEKAEKLLDKTDKIAYQRFSKNNSSLAAKYAWFEKYNYIV